MSLFKTLHKVSRDAVSELEIKEVTLYNDEPLVLTGKIATMDDNRPLDHALTLKFGKQGSRKRTGDKVIMETVRELYPFHVFTGWNVVDEAGNPIPYDAEKCKAQIMSEVSRYTVFDIAQHFTNPDNFREAVTKADGVEAGNASGG